MECAPSTRPAFPWSNFLRSFLRYTFVLLWGFACLALPVAARARQAQLQPPAATSVRAVPLVLEMRIDNEVEPMLAEYIDRGLEDAAKRHASLVLITMDTPGGLSTSMQDIIQHILASPVPVTIYVSPTGARAASAGFFILLSADVAAMASGTHTGAASPLLAIGGMPIQADETLKRKILNDATAFLRSYAAKRGRNVDLAETAVTQAKAWTETEALKGNLIDLIANSKEDLLSKLNGRTIRRFDGSSVQMELHNPRLIEFQRTFREKFLSRIVQPDAFFILLIVGVLGLYTEFTHPGMFFPGVIGGISLVLALYAMQILPVEPAGLVLILLALGLFVLEAKYPTHGVLAVGGVVSMLLGALMLIRSPLTVGGVSLGTAAGATIPFAIITVFLMRLVLRSRRWKTATGAEQLAGASAEVTEPFVASGKEGVFQGMVQLHGELWRAIARREIPVGARVRVTRMVGLTLHVEPQEEHSAKSRTE